MYVMNNEKWFGYRGVLYYEGEKKKKSLVFIRLKIPVLGSAFFMFVFFFFNPLLKLFEFSFHVGICSLVNSREEPMYPYVSFNTDVLSAFLSKFRVYSKMNYNKTMKNNDIVGK